MQVTQTTAATKTRQYVAPKLAKNKRKVSICFRALAMVNFSDISTSGLSSQSAGAKPYYAFTTNQMNNIPNPNKPRRCLQYNTLIPDFTDCESAPKPDRSSLSSDSEKKNTHTQVSVVSDCQIPVI